MFGIFYTVGNLVKNRSIEKSNQGGQSESTNNGQGEGTLELFSASQTDGHGDHGQNGGGAFLLLYVIFLFALGLPLLMAELIIGRLGRSDPSRSFEILASQQQTSGYWKTTGFISLFAALFLCLFVAWVIPRELSHREFALSGNYPYEI